MSIKLSGQTKDIASNLPKIAMQEIAKIRSSSSNYTFSHTIFIGINNLFPNLKLEENLLHQSFLKELASLKDFAESERQKCFLDETIFAFRKFYPKQIPHDILISASFLSSLLKNTDHIIYTVPNVISEHELAIANNIIKQRSLPLKTNFHPLESDVNRDDTTQKNNLIEFTFKSQKISPRKNKKAA